MALVSCSGDPSLGILLSHSSHKFRGAGFQKPYVGLLDGRWGGHPGSNLRHPSNGGSCCSEKPLESGFLSTCGNRTFSRQPRSGPRQTKWGGQAANAGRWLAQRSLLIPVPATGDRPAKSLADVWACSDTSRLMPATPCGGWLVTSTSPVGER